MADHRGRSLKITFTSCSGKGPTEMKRGKEKNTKKKFTKLILRGLMF